jgi:hypothetical protein
MSKLQIGLIIGLVIFALSFPWIIVWFSGHSWIASHHPGIQFCKFIELAAVAVLGILTVIKGVQLITSSDKDTAESLGCILIGSGALILGALLVFLGLNTNTYAGVRHMIIHAEAPGIKIDPKMKYDEETGTVYYKIPGSCQSVTVNFDFIDDKPKPRHSEVIINSEEVTDGEFTGWYSYQIDEDLKDLVERVGVFYIANGLPSGEKVWEKKPDPAPAVVPAAGSPAGGPAPGGPPPAVAPSTAI